MTSPPLPEAPERPDQSVLRNSRFLRLWAAQLVSQTAQNGLMFALLVLVTERTGSSLNGSLLVLAFMLPSVLLSIPAGVLVDRWPKRRVLVITNVLRAGMAAPFILFDGSVPALLLLAFIFSGIGQFFGPAEASTIPALVPMSRLISANALFQLTLTSSQFLGIVVLAPVLLKLGDPDLFFVAMIFLYGAAAALVAWLPSVARVPSTDTVDGLAGMLTRVRADVTEVLGTVRRDRISLLALIQLTTGSTLAMLFGLLVPRYVRDVLDISAENAVFVFAPLALGVVVGLTLVRWFTNRLPKQRVVSLGLFGIAAGLLALASVELIGGGLEQTRAREFVDTLGRYQPRFATFTLTMLVLLTMAYSVPIGFFFSLVSASAQTIIHERAPEEMRGRYFGTQFLLANAASLVVLLVIGVAADALGVTRVLVLFAPVVVAVGAYGWLATDSSPPPHQPIPPER